MSWGKGEDEVVCPVGPHFGTFSVVCANNLGGKLMAFFLGNMRERERKGQEKEVRTAEGGRDRKMANSTGVAEGRRIIFYMKFPTPNPFTLYNFKLSSSFPRLEL